MIHVQASSFPGRDHPAMRSLVLQVWDQLPGPDGVLTDGPSIDPLTTPVAASAIYVIVPEAAVE